MNIKKLLLGLLFILVVIIACIYILIPAKIIFSKVIFINTKINIANRFLMDESKWHKWFPSASVTSPAAMPGKNTYGYKRNFYSLKRQMLNSGEISILNCRMSLKSLATMISLNKDTIAIEWKSEMPGGSNPFKKMINYIKAKEIQNDMADILTHFKTFLEKNENVYGINLHVVISKDSTLVATKSITTGYPGTADIYNLVFLLKRYISDQKAKENNYPMLHVKKLNDTIYETMVAIPVDRRLMGNDKIFFKRFVPWKVLTAEVKGGTYTVNEALNQMDAYITDFHKEAMAIPFSSLVTDRSMQPDTLKWITSIYTPVR